MVDRDYRRPPPERELLPEDLLDEELDLLELPEERLPILELLLEELRELLDAREPDELLLEDPELQPLLLLREPEEFPLFHELLFP